MSLILKNKKGKVIDKCGYEEESGNIFYKEKKHFLILLYITEKY